MSDPGNTDLENGSNIPEASLPEIIEVVASENPTDQSDFDESQIEQ